MPHSWQQQVHQDAADAEVTWILDARYWMLNSPGQRWGFHLNVLGIRPELSGRQQGVYQQGQGRVMQILAGSRINPVKIPFHFSI